MYSGDTAYLDSRSSNWSVQYQTCSPQFAGEVDDDNSAYHYLADQQSTFANVPANINDGSNINVQMDMNIICNPSTDDTRVYPSTAFLYPSSDFAGRPDLHSDMKPTPRLNTQFDAIGHRHESISASLWSPSPSSGSIDIDLLYSRNQQYESPQSSTRSEYSFLNGLPNNDDGRHLSESYLDAIVHSDYNASACITISPQTLGASFGQESQLLDLLSDNDLGKESTTPPKAQVATERVLAASRKRRGQIKPGAKLLDCHLCGGTFTARHNLTNHINSHYGTRPYICIPQCGRAFGTNHVLKRHKKNCQEFITCQKRMFRC
ncbi:hypothetical protein J3R30DRAFT_2730982 [Lentinula aciculospora]|uniref:C2H2-type domain-containing protein n=1 Tax=Lentinula aciculospora TaxID=153920 RepID=A0A9W9DPC1_9AGAR|nr:hypothetical protein J3R30DRAFT_2730982 [Lentinula aciculospora]